jgi:hypothetical protein
MWSIRHWKEKMQRATKRAGNVVTVNGGASSCHCLLCPSQLLSDSHLLGRSHFNELRARFPDTVPVRVDDFWQTWADKFVTGAMAFNHVDGTLRMVRRPDGSEPPAPVLADLPADAHERVLAAVGFLPRPPQPPPPPLEEVEPAMSSTLAAGATETPAGSRQNFASVGSIGGTVSPWAELSPASLDPPTKPDGLGMQHQSAVGGGGGAFLWFWHQHAVLRVKRLEDVLTTALGASVARYCDLCQRSIAPSESFTEHVARDDGHIAQVQARFEQEGQNGHGWVQSWPGVAQLNHLTLEVSID